MDCRNDMLSHNVNIVASCHEGRHAGLAVAWATQCAVERIVICIGGWSATREIILASNAFALSVLRSNQMELSRLFGTNSSNDIDKFQGLATHTAETGSLLLDDAVAAFDCRVDNVFDDTTTKIIVGRIIHTELPEIRPAPLPYCCDDY